jgi:hypothetical protein
MFRDERPRSKLHVWTSRAESAWPIYDLDYRRRRLQAACKAASNQRGRQPCLLGLRSNRGTKGLGHLAPGELIQSCVGLSATLQSIMRCSFLGNNSCQCKECSNRQPRTSMSVRNLAAESKKRRYRAPALEFLPQRLRRSRNGSIRFGSRQGGAPRFGNDLLGSITMHGLQLQAVGISRICWQS